MDQTHLAALEQRHAYDSWRTPDPAQGSFFVWRYRIGGRELPGWRAHRIQQIDVPDTPRGYQSIWQRTDGRGHVLLSLDAYEATSAETARAFLLRLVAEFQSPLLERGTGIGDVVFNVPGEGSVLFARGNLVILLRNAGEETLALGDVARRFDENLRARPDGRMPWEEPPQITRFAAATERPVAGEPVDLVLEARAPGDGAVWFKLFGPPGILEAAAERIRFRPAAGGPQELTAYAIAPEGAAASGTLRLDVAAPAG